MQVSRAGTIGSRVTLWSFPACRLPCSLAQHCLRFMCRRALATSQYLLSHGTRSNVSSKKSEGSSAAAASPNCAHYFLDPLSWMRPELEQGKLEGRLECPKCSNNVGKYAWQGMQCSCGEWVVPGISLAKGRIDEVRKASFGIRRPPGMSGPPSLGAPHSKQNL